MSEETKAIVASNLTAAYCAGREGKDLTERKVLDIYSKFLSMLKDDGTPETSPEPPRKPSPPAAAGRSKTPRLLD